MSRTKLVYNRIQPKTRQISHRTEKKTQLQSFNELTAPPAPNDCKLFRHPRVHRAQGNASNALVLLEIWRRHQDLAELSGFFTELAGLGSTSGFTGTRR